MAKIRVLMITANENETNALLGSKLFENSNKQPKHSSDSTDVNYYITSEYGPFEFINLELLEQGSVKADAANLSISSAIRAFQPNAVIAVGIAFGRDNRDDENRKQQIGDVLISTKVADYESVKYRNGKTIPDSSLPDCGRELLSTIKSFSRTWEHKIDGKKVNCEFGTILSGDKLYDDLAQKTQLIKKYPSAIGGEMEARGIYAACRHNNLSEWIIVKGISDWGDGTKNKENKDKNQIDAATAAVSLLVHAFSQQDAFSKLKPNEDNNCSCERASANEHQNSDDDIIGYYINFGVTTCRLLAVYRSMRNNTPYLKEIQAVSYGVKHEESPDFLKIVVSKAKEKILSQIATEQKQFFIKVFADSSFSDVFVNGDKRNPAEEEKRRRKFVSDFYQETNLFFNILSQEQTEENLKRVFKNYDEKNTAVINIGSRYTDILIRQRQKYVIFNWEIKLDEIIDRQKFNSIPEKWSDSDIETLKSFIRDRMPNDIKDIKVDQAIIIKDELAFMTDNNYDLATVGGTQSVSMDDYKRNNREELFYIDFREKLSDMYDDEATIERFYGFKYGHILLETLFENMGVKRVIPKNDLSIHGGLNAYIFNVVVSGSANGEHAQNMIDACRVMSEMGATVQSPKIKRNGTLKEKTKKSDLEHAEAIRNCDLLFVSNKDGYIGEQTAMEIYGAFLLVKPIAFWTEPSSDDKARLSFIPHEKWETLMKYLENDT